MPKMKSHSGAKKRFRVTGSGKVKMYHSQKNHILTKKSRKRKRSLRQVGYFPTTQENNIKRIIPYKKAN
ncbi:MAG: 50S ribosomal protein L35 [Clostridiales bacterium]|nr:50S ribosomal protein L35 [Clostridiales bacterium]